MFDVDIHFMNANPVDTKISLNNFLNVKSRGKKLVEHSSDDTLRHAKIEINEMTVHSANG